jgi:hypothetical protein
MDQRTFLKKINRKASMEKLKQYFVGHISEPNVLNVYAEILQVNSGENLKQLFDDLILNKILSIFFEKENLQETICSILNLLSFVYLKLKIYGKVLLLDLDFESFLKVLQVSDPQKLLHVYSNFSRMYLPQNINLQNLQINWKTV